MSRAAGSMVTDPRTGRVRRVDPKRSRAAKVGARGRSHVVDSQTRKAISLGLKRVARTGRTRFGRRAK